MPVTLQEITQLVAFNRWANRCVFDALSQLPADQYARDLHSSHGGIHGTLAHIVSAERGWLSRWQGKQESGTSGISQLRSLAELRAFWEGVCDEMSQFLATLDDHQLQQTL